MLEAILDRLCRRSSGKTTTMADIIDWEQTNDAGLDFLSLAAEHQMLSLVWDILKKYQVPFFFGERGARPHLLRTRVWGWDWERVREAGEAAHFTLLHDVLPASRPTAALERLTRLSAPNHLEAAARWVREGADIFFQSPEKDWPLLHHWVSEGNVGMVAACLESPLALDFRRTGGPFRYTVLHWLSDVNPLEAGVEMLRCFLHRLERHPCDTVDWAQGDSWGRSFLLRTAEAGRLSAFWPLLCHVPFFDDQTQPLKITCPVSREDWRCLGEEEQSRLLPLVGFKKV